MSNYYAWGRRRGDTEWEKVEVVDCGRDGYQVVGKSWSMSEKDVEIKDLIEPPTPELNLHQMLEDILLWVENDFCFDMELKTMDNAEPYTQDEAREMAQRLAKVYGIAHSIHCEACAKKYLK